MELNAQKGCLPRTFSGPPGWPQAFPSALIAARSQAIMHSTCSFPRRSKGHNATRKRLDPDHRMPSKPGALAKQLPRSADIAAHDVEQDVDDILWSMRLCSIRRYFHQ